METLNEWTYGRFWTNLIIIRNRSMHSKTHMDMRFDAQRNGGSQLSELKSIKRSILKNGQFRQWKIPIFSNGTLTDQTEPFSEKHLSYLKGNGSLNTCNL